MAFSSGVYTPASGATSATGGQTIASATWNGINTDYTTALNQLGQNYAIYTVTVPSITVSKDNFNPTGVDVATVLRLSSDASRTISGIAAQTPGKRLFLLNVGAQDIVLSNSNASSSAANRFDIAADITITTKKCALIYYDGTDSNWKALSR